MREPDQTGLVYGMIMKASNLQQLVESGNPEPVVDDLWFNCAKCNQMHHWTAVYLIHKPHIAYQSVAEFLCPSEDGHIGLAPELNKAGMVYLRCVECTNKDLGLQLEPVEAPLAEGTKIQ